MVMLLADHGRDGGVARVAPQPVFGPDNPGEIARTVVLDFFTGLRDYFSPCERGRLVDGAWT